MTALAASPASERNKRPILDALLNRLPASGRLLEIGSGYGQHAVFFAAHCPGLVWQPSDRPGTLHIVAERVRREGTANVMPPIELDVADRWPEGDFQAAYSANTAHIMGWDEVKLMFAGLGRCLAPSAPFFLYGPFNRDGQFTAPSNESFDASLRARDPRMGLRDLVDIERLAQQHGMALLEDIGMPANNLLLHFQRQTAAKDSGQA